jgi:Leucine-rich repeat (LRR) protein
MHSVVRFTRNSVGMSFVLLTMSCSQQFTVSVNNQALFDPAGRLISNEVTDPDLQGCINLAIEQQNIRSALELTVLSCADSEVNDLNNIGQLTQLRFLDLANNQISNITPLENLQELGGLNLMNNAILDITPLLTINSLTSVSLIGNQDIPCSQLQLLREKLGDNLSEPISCNN